MFFTFKYFKDVSVVVIFTLLVFESFTCQLYDHLRLFSLRFIAFTIYRGRMRNLSKAIYYTFNLGKSRSLVRRKRQHYPKQSFPSVT